MRWNWWVRHIWPTIRVATMQDVEKIESYFDRVDGVLAVGEDDFPGRGVEGGKKLILRVDSSAGQQV